jgi:hypothetical protein
MLPWKIGTKHVKLIDDYRVLKGGTRSIESFDS